MSDVPYFKPQAEGPIFPDEAGQLIEDAETFLRASDRDVDDAVACRNMHDLAEDSFTLWIGETLKKSGIDFPKSN